MDDLGIISSMSFRKRLRPAFKRLMVGVVFLMLIVMLGINVGAVTVSVSRFSLYRNPGETVDGEFTIRNGDADAIAVDIELVDWDRTLEGVTQFHQPGTLERSCAGWISLSHYDAALAPNAEIEIRWEAHPPDDVSGTYWAGLLINVNSIHATTAPGDIQLIRQFLIRVFVTILPANATGRVSDVRVHGINPLGVEVTFENTGDTLLSNVTGLIAVKSSTGKSLFEIPLVAFDVLPGYVTRQLVSGDLGLHSTGLYLILAVFDFGADYLVAGQSVLRLRDLRLVPIGTSTLLPKDADGDGLYEDIDGNGLVTMADVNLLQAFIDSRPVQDNARAFDFDNDGIVTSADLNVLRDMVLRASD